LCLICGSHDTVLFGILQVLHIDLGIAFEQGMFLSTPERVPFRLTANVIDGMGAAGLEGTFRRCCETTLQVGLQSVVEACRMVMINHLCGLAFGKSLKGESALVRLLV
jgi:hypothetical protein